MGPPALVTPYGPRKPRPVDGGAFHKMDYSNSLGVLRAGMPFGTRPKPFRPSAEAVPGFWQNLNRKLVQRTPRIGPVNHKLPPWDDLHLIQEERHPFAHLGAG